MLSETKKRVCVCVCVWDGTGTLDSIGTHLPLVPFAFDTGTSKTVLGMMRYQPPPEQNKTAAVCSSLFGGIIFAAGWWVFIDGFKCVG